MRFEPLDAQSTCYVYDTQTMKLLTQFDDQHFGSFYQYNAEGQLIRQKVETERGLKTIKETHYHTPLEHVKPSHIEAPAASVITNPISE